MRPRRQITSVDRSRNARLVGRRSNRKHRRRVNLVATEVARLTRLDSDDFRFDHKIVGAADHDEMFGIVAADDDQLALPIEIKGVDNAKPRLAGPPTRHPQTAAKQHSDNEEQQQGRNEKGDYRRSEHQWLVLI